MSNTIFLKFIAIFLITNSHLDKLYPISQLSTGGALGNAIFFFISGYGITKSKSIYMNKFLDWFKIRISRIYPTVIIGTMITYLIENKKINFIDLVKDFVYPTQYWFISAILIFYIILYPIIKSKKKYIYKYMFLIITILYFIIYFKFVNINYFTIEGVGYFKWIFYLGIMLLGSYVAIKDKKEKIYSLKTNTITLILIIITYFGFKIFMDICDVYKYQFVIHIITILFIIEIWKISNNKSIDNFICNNTSISKLAKLFASLTLEMYILQKIIYDSNVVLRLKFPLNILIFWILLLIISNLVKKITGYIINRIYAMRR